MWVRKEGTIGSIWEAIGGTQWRGTKREETIKEQGGGVTRQKWSSSGKLFQNPKKKTWSYFSCSSDLVFLTHVWNNCIEFFGSYISSARDSSVTELSWVEGILALLFFFFSAHLRCAREKSIWTGQGYRISTKVIFLRVPYLTTQFSCKICFQWLQCCLRRTLIPPKKVLTLW